MSADSVPNRFQIRSILFATAWMLSSAACAQDTTTYEEQYKRIKAPNAVTQYGPDLFGESVNLYNGALEFTQTDVSLRGNNKLPVSIGRKLRTSSKPLGGRAFGRWEMDIPHMHGIFPKTEGWRTSGSNPMLRCAQYSVPPPVRGSLTSSWDPEEYWHGNFLYVPGVGDQRVLGRSSGAVAIAGLPLQTYPAITSQFWAISCVPTLDSDTTPGKTQGDGFVATSPDGIKYTFNWMVDFTAPQLIKPNDTAMMAAGPGGETSLMTTAQPAADDGTSTQARSFTDPGMTPNIAYSPFLLARKEVWILPTLVTDRFGNWVRYTYDSAHPRNLMTITSSETPARTISLTYYPPDAKGDMLVQSVSDGTRTWTYGYHTDATALPNLDYVLLPDGSRWNFAGTDDLIPNPILRAGGCDAPGAGVGAAYTGSMVHPSGAIGSFTVTATTHGRSDVPYECQIEAPGATFPKYFNTYSLTNKTINGPGLPTMSWNYDYGNPNASWSPCNGCITNKTVTVTDPNGNATEHVFGNRYNVSEGRIEQVNVGGRTTVTSYQPFGAGPYPDVLGSAYDSSGDAEMAARLAPANQRVTTQQGASFTWKAVQFDDFARVTKTSRLSSLNSGRDETTKYADNNFAVWGLGQVEKVIESSTGTEMVSNTYDLGSAVLTSVARFGKVTSTMTYYADGSLNTIKDGKNQTTTFSNYKRGVAQSIVYADGASESAVIDNIGNFASVTNAANSTTTFGYTAGRLSSINYPTGGPVAWTGTTIAFEPVANNEFDLPAGHWRQTVTTGNANAISYYDALWRPVYSYAADYANPGATSRLVKRQYDFQGHATFESYPKRTYAEIGDGVQTQYDALGRVVATGASSELGMLWTTTSYLGGFQKSVTDPKGHVTTTSFQAFDEPAERAAILITATLTNAPSGVNVAIARDIFGKTTSITRGDGSLSTTRSYVYDKFARLCKTVEPETGATIQDYDAANNVIWRASGNALPSTSACDTDSVASARKVTFGYDLRNRLSTTTYADGSPSITRTYTADGLPNTITSNGSVWTNTYNNRRQNQIESLSYGGTTYNITRGYDGNGSLATLTYPDGVSITYSPNALGQATQVGGYASGITYYPNGAINSFNYGNGVAHTQGQNIRGLPSQSTDSGVLNDAYTYDANGNVASIMDLQAGTTNRTMGYDDLDRLTSVSSPNLWGTATYTYDAVDNLRTSTITGGATARTLTMGYPDPSTNRLMSTSGGPAGFNFDYGYDAQGNIIKRGAQTYAFDQGNRMTSAAGKATYGYDGLGHRISVVGTDGVNRVQVYSQGGQLLYGAPGGSAATKYIYMHDHVLAEVGPAGVQYDHTDGLGSPVARTDANRGVISRTHYEPYGYTAAGAVPGIGFTGHANDTDTGLVYMQQRYYDPVGGRFLSVDPVLTNANTGTSFNRYAYADNNPLHFVDPDGRGPVGWTVILLKNGRMQIGRALSSHAEAVAARRANENVAMGRKSGARAVELAKNGGNDGSMLRHAGHPLENGQTGLPHFQTEGAYGHTFWGKLSAGFVGFKEAMAISSDEIWADMKSDPVGALCWICSAGNEKNDSDLVWDNPAITASKQEQLERDIKCGVSCGTKKESVPVKVKVD